MNIKTFTSLSSIFFVGMFLMLSSCEEAKKDFKRGYEDGKKDAAAAAASKDVKNPSDVFPGFYENFKLILGNGENVGIPVGKQNKDFFYTANEGGKNWVVYKTPNAGNTHGTSNNTRTELGQTKKWTPLNKAKMTGTCKVMNVSSTGDARVAATYSVVVGQIHSADGHENEPLKIYYKKFPGHEKGSVFWNYEINTKGEDNGGRWDFSTPVWGYDFSVVGKTADTYPDEPKDGIKLGEPFSYEVELKGDGIMHVKFMSEGHETKTFSKNLIKSEYTKKSDMPEQVRKLFVPIGQDGVEVADAYTTQGCFFKQGSYNQTNGKDPSVNGVWCSGAETHGGDLKKQYADGNYAEVWFSEASIVVDPASISNEQYFTNNDHLQQRQAKGKK